MLRKFVHRAALVAALFVVPLGLPAPSTLPAPAVPLSWLAPLPALALDYDLNEPKDFAAVTVTNAATKLFSATIVASQPYRGAFIQPTNGEIAVGGASVTTATGFLMPTMTTMWLDWSRGGNWYGIRTGGSNVDVRVVPVR